MSHTSNIDQSTGVSDVAIQLASLEVFYSLGQSGLLPTLLTEIVDVENIMMSIDEILKYATSLVLSVETLSVLRNAAIKAISSLYCYCDKHSGSSISKENAFSGESLIYKLDKI